MLNVSDDIQKIYDDIPINSPEYLKRFQCSFRPFFVSSSQQKNFSSHFVSSGSGCAFGYGIDLI